MCVGNKMVEYAFGRLSQQGRKTVDYHPAVIRYLEVSERRYCKYSLASQTKYLLSAAVAYELQRHLLHFLHNTRIMHGIARVASSLRMRETGPLFSRTRSTTLL